MAGSPGDEGGTQPRGGVGPCSIRQVWSPLTPAHADLDNGLTCEAVVLSLVSVLRVGGPCQEAPPTRASGVHAHQVCTDGQGHVLGAAPSSLSPLGHGPRCVRPTAPELPAHHCGPGRRPPGPSPGTRGPPSAPRWLSPSFLRVAFLSGQMRACSGLSLRPPPPPSRGQAGEPPANGALISSVVLQLESPVIPVRPRLRARNILPTQLGRRVMLPALH